ncbi:MAG: ABC transporter ATP-binding protein [Burkholderiales bacterium]|nr:ABC transporter ATP-binding protein [Burkholderiales bacterium]
MTTITLSGIDKSFGAVRIVRDLNLTVADREFLVLLGPSGCGKTTTMRMVAGLEHPTLGEIAFDGVRINEVPTQRRDVAMVFQNYGLYPHMSVAQNIAYPLKLRGVPAAERERLVARAAERVELTPYLARMPRELSGGQRQRVALARSIVRKPRVFLMDEPLSNLDAKLRVVARAQIKHLAQELEVTTIYVTHDQVEAMTLAHRVAVMRDGVIHQLGAPAEIYNDPADAFVAGFIGNPAMNLVDVEAEGAGVRAEGGLAIALAAPRPGRLTLGARAEDMRIVPASEAHFQAPVYTFELLGEATMATVMVGHTLVAIKAPKDLRLEPDTRIGVRFDPARLFWFDAASGARVRA